MVYVSRQTVTRASSPGVRAADEPIPKQPRARELVRKGMAPTSRLRSVSEAQC